MSRSPVLSSPLVLPRLVVVTAGVGALVLAGTVAFAGSAHAAQAPVGLGTAGSFAVLAGATVTNTGPSTLSGDVGVSPGTATPGLTAAMVTGAVHTADAVAAQAQSDLTTAYVDAAGRSPVTAVPADLVGQVLQPGVYGGPTLALSGTVTLDAGGDPAAVFVLQSASTLILAGSSTVHLVNGADACNVFWQVGSSATLGTDSTFVGNLLALTSISATTGASVDGLLLARNGAVTLDDNTIVRPTCATTGTPGSTAPTDPSTPAGSSSGPGQGTTAPAGSTGPTSTASTGAGSTTGAGSGTGSGATTGSGSTTGPGSSTDSPLAPGSVTGSGSDGPGTGTGASGTGTALTSTYSSTSRPASTGVPVMALSLAAAALLALGVLTMTVSRRPRRRGLHR